MGHESCSTMVNVDPIDPTSRSYVRSISSRIVDHWHSSGFDSLHTMRGVDGAKSDADSRLETLFAVSSLPRIGIGVRPLRSHTAVEGGRGTPSCGAWHALIEHVRPIDILCWRTRNYDIANFRGRAHAYIPLSKKYPQPDWQSSEC